MASNKIMRFLGKVTVIHLFVVFKNMASVGSSFRHVNSKKIFNKDLKEDVEFIHHELLMANISGKKIIKCTEIDMKDLSANEVYGTYDYCQFAVIMTRQISEMDGDYENSDFDENIEITELDDSRYSTSFHVSKKYFGLIIGTPQKTKNSIELDTKTELKITGYGQDGDITILGPTAANVKAARQQINKIVVLARMKQRPTHFISIPMNKPDIMDNFTQFQEAVLRDCQNRGLHESIFIKPSKLHLTVGVTCLTDNQERLFASNLLTEAKEKVIIPLLQDHLPLKIRIRGLSDMGNDSRNMKVLYANVEEHESKAGILQQLADKIVDFYSRKGLMNKNEFGRDSVKLHVTLLNIKYRSKSSQNIRVKNKRIPFDGADILDRFGDFNFGVLDVTEIHLSQISTIGPDGYYEPTFKISIP